MVLCAGMRNRAFTLIELLVVIAIIGLLSSVVLASLSSSRLKARDAIIKQTMNSLRSQAAVYFSVNNNYGTKPADAPTTSPPAPAPLACNTPLSGSNGFNGTMFITDTNVVSLLDQAGIASGGTGAGSTYCVYHANGAGYATSVQLVSTGASDQYWCVDSSGVSRQAIAVSSDRGINMSTRLCR